MIGLWCSDVDVSNLTPQENIGGQSVIQPEMRIPTSLNTIQEEKVGYKCKIYIVQNALAHYKMGHRFSISWVCFV